MEIPEDYIEFLYWIKEKTETHWKNKVFEEYEYDDIQFNDNCMIGAKWIGLDENKIDSIEAKYKVKFTPEHREFLKILHTIDRKEISYYYGENDEVCQEERPFFYNWLTDDQYLKDYLKWPYIEILRDINGINKTWPKSWDKRPKSDIEREKVFSEWFEKAPRVTPISGHQFVISDFSNNHSPVISIWGCDIVIFGWGMKSYLLHILSNYIDFKDLYYDKEDEGWFSTELRLMHEKNYKLIRTNKIPYWQDIIEHWK